MEIAESIGALKAQMVELTKAVTQHAQESRDGRATTYRSLEDIRLRTSHVERSVEDINKWKTEASGQLKQVERWKERGVGASMVITVAAGSGGAIVVAGWNWFAHKLGLM